MKRQSVFVLILTLFLSAGCATRGPVVPQAPSVQVTQLDALLFTPDIIKFQAKIVINNQMNAGLNIQKVDFGADVQGKQIFTQSFDQLKPMRAFAQQTVTFPFQIAIKDIKDQAVAILADEAMQVSFRGQVHPAGEFGFDPIPFKMTRKIPFPRVPTVSVERTEGSPLKVFTVFLKIKNNNSFPLNIQSLNSYIELNGTKYGLLGTEESTEIKAGADRTIALKMEQTTGKTLSMALNVAQSSSLRFVIGGEIRCRTPYGLVYIPVKLQSEE